jgi:hypothetical protein
MSPDISSILSHWSYDDDETLQVRRIEGRDGRPRLQLRVDLGLLQMEWSDRPDGQRPHGFPSLLEHHRAAAQDHRNRFGWYEGFELDPDDCARLRQESLQYYHRRIAFMALQEFSLAAADADHNLEILDLIKAFARRREDWWASEQYRAFIVSHRVQCLTLLHLSREDVRAAMLEVSRGIRLVREIFAEQDRLDEFEESGELAALEDLKRKLEAQYEVTHRQHLQIMLDDALRREDPDVAADLRSQLRRLDPDG